MTVEGVREQTAGLGIENMKLPLCIVATDLNSGQPTSSSAMTPAWLYGGQGRYRRYFSPSGAASASMPMPGLVTPVRVRFAHHLGAEPVLAVDISSPPDRQATGDAMRMLL